MLLHDRDHSTRAHCVCPVGCRRGRRAPARDENWKNGGRPILTNVVPAMWLSGTQISPALALLVAGDAPKHGQRAAAHTVLREGSSG
jgi:hypothetical protein